ncbi:MAG: bifunctional precorrin-2 dehydrogenase/sirohydrochlorin ferrochelatase [Deltaproteobacteria bacterium]|jgi:siroheme synthase-like protein|nr:bifunctional precorrin-2 dehydrogenase/sirohydrochlorin ferrochelatase [Deltaproteobacteria bacterium]
MGSLFVNVDFAGRPALLIGAGSVGRRKLGDLLAAGADVLVVEPDPVPETRQLAAEGRLRLASAFDETMLDSGPWIFVAVGDGPLAAKLAQLAKARNLPINVADRPELCSFMMPALAADPPFAVAVSTDGTSPALAAAVAAELRARYRGYGAVASLLGRLRPLVLASDLPIERRRVIFKRLAGAPELACLLSEGREAELRALIEGLLAPVSLPSNFLLL